MASVKCARVLAVVALLEVAAAFAAVSATDDAGATIVLEKPAARIVSLAPHATELLYAAGARHGRHRTPAKTVAPPVEKSAASR